jgi:hypothetical protein
MSSAEAELIALSQAAHYSMGIEAVLEACGIPMKINMLCDNLAAVKIIKENNGWKSRFYKLRGNRIKECIDDGVVNLLFVSGAKQVADILTKHSSKAVLLTCLWLAKYKEWRKDKWAEIKMPEMKYIKAEFMKRDKNIIMEMFKTAIAKNSMPGENLKSYMEQDYMPTNTQWCHRLWHRMQPEQPGVVRMLAVRQKMTPQGDPMEEEGSCGKPPPGSWFSHPINVWKQRPGREATGWIWTPSGTMGKWCTSPIGDEGVCSKMPYDGNGNWIEESTLVCPNCGKQAICHQIWRHDKACLCPVASMPPSFMESIPHWLATGKQMNAMISKEEKTAEDYEFELEELSLDYE